MHKRAHGSGQMALLLFVCLFVKPGAMLGFNFINSRGSKGIAKPGPVGLQPGLQTWKPDHRSKVNPRSSRCPSLPRRAVVSSAAPVSTGTRRIKIPPQRHLGGSYSPDGDANPTAEVSPPGRRSCHTPCCELLKVPERGDKVRLLTGCLRPVTS